MGMSLLVKNMREVMEDPQKFKTLVIDPFTAIWEHMQDKQLRRMRVKQNNMNYTLQPLDYKLLKANVKGIIQKLLALDLNIICTSRARVEYSQAPGEFMKPVGLQPDGPKDLPYMFDVVLQLSVADDGKRMAKVIKSEVVCAVPCCSPRLMSQFCIKVSIFSNISVSVF